MHVNENSETLDCVNLLVSVLVCFPEIAAIRFDNQKQNLDLSFFITMESEGISQIRAEIEDALALYHKISHSDIIKKEISQYTFNDYTVLQISRDFPTMTRGEIAFLADLMVHKFGKRLYKEVVDLPDVGEDFGWYQKDAPSVKANNGQKNIVFAIRDSGKIFVFNY